MNTTAQALRLYVALTLTLGLGYPALVTLLARGVAPDAAAGSLVIRDGRVVGSALIAQDFTSARYVHPRPSAINYDPLASGASNQGPLSVDLARVVEARRAALASEGTASRLYASGSGLDPDLDLASALAQVTRVARARGMAEDRVRSIISTVSTPRQFGVLGEPRVNVLRLNLALDESR